MFTTDQTSTITASRPRDIRVLPLDHAEAYGEWRTMFDRDPLANPLQHPDYVLEELKRTTMSTVRPALLRYGTDETCDGIAIVVPKSIGTQRVGGVGPGWILHGLRLPGGNFLTVDASEQTHAKLLSAAAQYCLQSGADFLLFEDLDEASCLHRAVYSAAASGFQRYAIRDVQSRWRIEFPTEEETYWKTFSSRTRRAFRTRLKKFGETRLERVVEEQQLPAFLAAANAISKQSWQSRQFGLRIRNDQAELRELSTLARLGFLRSYLWQVEGEPAAFAFCHQHAGCFRYEEIAYCARFGSLSPGETMLQQIVEDLYRHDLPQSFDFGGGDAEYKQRFGNRESHSQSLWLVPPTFRGHAVLAYLQTCRQFRSSARRMVKLFGMATKARQWLRYGGRAGSVKINAATSTNSDDAMTVSEKERDGLR